MTKLDAKTEKRVLELITKRIYEYERLAKEPEYIKEIDEKCGLCKYIPGYSWDCYKCDCSLCPINNCDTKERREFIRLFFDFEDGYFYEEEIKHVALAQKKSLIRLLKKNGYDWR